MVLDLDEILEASPIEMDIYLSEGMATMITVSVPSKAAAIVYLPVVFEHLHKVSRFGWKYRTGKPVIGFRFLTDDTGEEVVIAGDGTGYEFMIADLPALVSFFGKERITIEAEKVEGK